MILKKKTNKKLLINFYLALSWFNIYAHTLIHSPQAVPTQGFIVNRLLCVYLIHIPMYVYTLHAFEGMFYSQKLIQIFQVISYNFSVGGDWKIHGSFVLTSIVRVIFLYSLNFFMSF